MLPFNESGTESCHAKCRQPEGSLLPPGGSRLGLMLDSAATRTSWSVDDGYSLASVRLRSRSSWLSLGASLGLRCFQSSSSSAANQHHCR